MSNILLIDGHPDPDRARFVHALADAYAEGAEAGGHEVRRIALARLDFPLLRSRTAWTDHAPPGTIADAQEAILWARHLVFFYPLWLGDMPALLKGFLEQVARPGFALGEGPRPGHCWAVGRRGWWSRWGCPRSSIAAISAPIA